MGTNNTECFIHPKSGKPSPEMLSFGQHSSSGIRDNHRRGTVGDFLRAELKAGADLDIVTAYFTRLIASAVETITATFQQKLASGLQGRRDFVIPLVEEQPQEDEAAFDLVTWLVLHEATP